MMQEMLTAAEKSVLLDRLGQDKDIIQILKFLSGPKATWVTRTSVVIDEGEFKSY